MIVWQYILAYARDADKKQWLAGTVYAALLIFANYHYHLNQHIISLSFAWQMACWMFIFALAFLAPHVYIFIAQRKKINIRFYLLATIACSLFAWKMSYTPQFAFSQNESVQAFWSAVVYWPFKGFIITIALYLVWRLFDAHENFYGFAKERFNAKPYLLMLAGMIPLIALASTQVDFLRVYPKVLHAAAMQGNRHYWQIILYELSYGSDFFTIELFFRGFLIGAFVKWAGKDALLPAAVFYCTIHFGKPLGECISSFFGGAVLSIVIYNTRNLFGGLIVHLGIAWLMEAFPALIR